LQHKVTVRRLQWVIAAVLMFFGIFAASTRGPIASHVPQCAGARAIGAQTSLASAKRESRPLAQTIQPVLLKIVVQTPLGLSHERFRKIESAPAPDTAFERYSTALFRRPPPQVSFA
jgi:hypothetical protein